MSNIRVIGFAAGLAIVAGLILASMERGEEDRRQREIFEACHQADHEVPVDCPALFPDVEVCRTEDCSDINGQVGYWVDGVDGRVYMTLNPRIMRTGAQSPHES